MWAQYGDDHKGACIVFDRHRINEAVQSLDTLGEFCAAAVTYTRQLRELIGVMGYYEAGGTTSPREHLIANREAQLFCKDPDWSNENEYRVVSIPNDRGVTEAFIPIDQPRSVIGVVVGDQVERQGLDAVDYFASVFDIKANTAQCSWNNPLHFGASVIQLESRPPTDG
jgi:hypothetical protein